MLLAEDADVIFAVARLAPDERADVRENDLVFIVHVLAHLGDVLIEIAHDGERDVAVSAVDRLDQLAADQGQAEVEKIAVRVLQIAYERLDRKRRIDLFDGHMIFDQQVDDRQKGLRVDAAVGADLADRFVPESERYSEPAEHQ